MTTKEDHERTVLSEFLQQFLPNGISYRIESRNPPEPDLLAETDTGTSYYELARILDKNLPTLRLEASKINPEHVSVDTSKIGLPERDIVVEKSKKTYDKRGLPVNLLLYYDEGFLNGGYPPFELQGFLDDIIPPVLENDTNFNKVYVYDRHTKKILWESGPE